MNRALISLSWYALTLVTGHVLGPELKDSILQIPNSRHIPESPPLPPQHYQHLKPRSYLVRRGKKKASDRGTGNGAQSRDRLNPKASIQAAGRADISAFNPLRPGHIENVQQKLLVHGQHDSLRTEHRVAAAVVGKQLDPAPPNAEHQPVAEHPLKAEGQGRMVVGSVKVPEGGRGYMRMETPSGAKDIYVSGGVTHDDFVYTGASDANKLSVSVTSGGRVQAGGHASLDSFAQYAMNSNDNRT